MHISALAIYPVKSLGPVMLQEAEVTPRGLAGDRRWMIVDAQGRFVTRREVPTLARIAVSLDEDDFLLRASEGEALLPATLSDGALTPVTVWRNTVGAYVVENEACRLVSDVADQPLRLVYMPETTHRAVNPAYSNASDVVSFADGFPMLVTSEASLAALNAALDTPVEMERFRPNIVLSGVENAWAERGWRVLEVGGILLRLPKPCSRCIVVTQQPKTGARQEGNAVPMALRRLVQFNSEGALFGMNAVPEGVGRVAVGDLASLSG